MGGPVVRRAAVAIGLAVALVTGCSSEDPSDDLQTIEPATAALAPPPATEPAGVVSPLQAVTSLVAAPGTDSLVALADDGSTLLVLDDGTEPRRVALPTAAVTVVPGPDGSVLAPASNVVLQVDVSDGNLTEHPVDGDARSAVVLDDGRWAVGTGQGRVLVLDPASGEVQQEITGLASADALVVTDGILGVLDRRQTSLTEIDLEEDRLGVALRAGIGATNMISDPFGRVTIADSTGNELQVYTLDSLIMRQRYPAGRGPFGLVYDETRDLVWVTSTGTNEVVGYDLSTGIPRERHRFATVQQPDSVAVDPRDASVVVASATGGGLQRIPVEG